MTRSAVIAPFLPSAARNTLEANVKQILPCSSEQLAQFLDTAEEAVDIYRKLRIPANREDREQETELRQVVKTGRAFSRALAALPKGDASDLIRQAQGVVIGEIPEIEQSIALPEITAQTAERLLLAKNAPIDALIADVAFAYGAVFGMQPSAARNGIFAKILPDILSACLGDLAPEIGESHLKRVLGDRQYIPGPRPKRGRRPAVK
jgi:hypothetical protein